MNLNFLPLSALGLAFLPTLEAAPSKLVQFGAEGRTSTMQLSTREFAEILPNGQSRLIKSEALSHPYNGSYFQAASVSPYDVAGARQAPVYYPEGEIASELNCHILTKQVMLRSLPGIDREGLRLELENNGFLARAPTYSTTLIVITLPDPESAAVAMSALRNFYGVASVEPVFSKKAALAWMPNDPLFKGDGVAAQWYLNPADPRNIGVTDWWDQYKGNGVRINVVDSGVQTNHPDLIANTDRDNDRDYLDDDDNPNPPPEDYHGTAVAGIIAGKGNNGKGICGVAPESTLVALRLNFSGENPIEFADCLHHRSSNTEISNNSWGYRDNGTRFAQAGTPVEESFRDGAVNGRSGRGLIYLFAAGNDGERGGDANRSDLLTTPYVTVIGALSPTGVGASFSTPGANVSVSTWGESITTTTTLGGYINTFNGTSAATPITSGVVALMLDARPELGWRDVQDILMRTALVPPAEAASFRRNRGGYSFNNKYGAGILSGERAIRLARRWSPLPNRITKEYPISPIYASIADNKPTGEVRSFSVPSSQNMRVESVQLVINVEHERRGDLQIDLISPSGHTSRILNASPQDQNKTLAWTFRSVQFWGENSVGTWKAKIVDTAAGISGRIIALKLRLYGSSRTNAPNVNGGYTVEGHPGELFQLETSASESPSNYRAEGLPAGLTMDDLGMIKGTPLTPGVFPVNVFASNANGERSNVITLNILPPLQTGLALWTTLKLSSAAAGLSSPTADPDGDGVPNIIEYATGGDPLINNPGDGLITSLQPEGLSFIWNTSTDPLEVILKPQISFDLKNWSDLLGGEIISTTTSQVTRRVILPLTDRARFVRLRVN